MAIFCENRLSYPLRRRKGFISFSKALRADYLGVPEKQLSRVAR